MGRTQPRSDRRPGHVSDHLGAHLDAGRQHGPRLHRLRHLVRLRHLRGRHRHLLGAQPRRRVPAGHPRTAAGGRRPRRSGPTRPASAGCSSTRWWTRPGSRRWRTFAASRTGTCATGWRPFRAWPKWPASAASCSSTRSTSIPARLAAYDLGVKDVVDAIRASNNDVEGRLLEFAGREYMVRGRGYLSSVADIEQVSLGADPRGTPIRVSDVARVQLGPDIRRGVAELDGRGEVVGGIVVMRFGENAHGRDRSGQGEAARGAGRHARRRDASSRPTTARALIGESIATLRETLIEEAVVVSLVIILFLFHIRSALVPILALPVAVAAAFIPMYYLGVTANIMSLGGIALAIGVLVDAAIVMVENAYRHVSEPEGGRSRRLRGAAARRSSAAARQVGRADLLLARHHRRLVRAGVSAGGAGRADVPAARLHQDVRDGRRGALLDHARAGADGHAGAGPEPAAGIAEPDLAAVRRLSTSRSCALALRWRWAALADQRGGDPVDHPAGASRSAANSCRRSTRGRCCTCRRRRRACR